MAISQGYNSKALYGIVVFIHILHTFILSISNQNVLFSLRNFCLNSYVCSLIYSRIFCNSFGIVHVFTFNSKMLQATLITYLDYMSLEILIYLSIYVYFFLQINSPPNSRDNNRVYKASSLI